MFIPKSTTRDSSRKPPFDEVLALNFLWKMMFLTPCTIFSGFPAIFKWWVYPWSSFFELQESPRLLELGYSDPRWNAAKVFTILHQWGRIFYPTYLKKNRKKNWSISWSSEPHAKKSGDQHVCLNTIHQKAPCQATIKNQLASIPHAYLPYVHWERGDRFILPPPWSRRRFSPPETEER